jgi:4-phytase/acid phosphatase
MILRVSKLLWAPWCYFLLGGALCTLSARDQRSQPQDDDEIRSVVVIARHGVRVPIESEVRESAYNAQPWPSWPDAPGVLTQHGTVALRLLGDYYRFRYPSLLQHHSCKDPGIYVEGNTTQRTIASAKAMLTGLAPDCPVKVHFLPKQNNSLFSPPGGLVDIPMLTSATDGRMANQPDWFTNAFAGPLARMHHVLVDCSGKNCDKAKADFRTLAVVHGVASARSANMESPVARGADFAENFLLQYTEGMPMDQVGWGRVSRDDLNYLMEMNTRYHDFMLRTPYYAQVSASDLAAHLRDTILASATGKAMANELGTPRDRFVLLVGHDSNLSWLGGLLRIDWLLPDQTFNATPPGSALVFEVHKSKATGASTVQVLFISQTLDQMRYLRPMSAADRPSVAPIFVPGCSGAAPPYACSVKDFTRLVTAAIDDRMVESHTF